MATSRTFKHAEVVNVYLWGNHVGAVALDPRFGFYVFEYTDKFKRLAIEPAPLTMPTNNVDPYIFTDLPPETYKRLPAMLSDSLPDDFGNALIDRWMAEKGIDKASVTPLDRLAYMDNRAMGALQFKPSKGPRHKPFAIDMSELVREARRAVEGSVEDDAHANAALRAIIAVGTSAGGARAKAVIAWNPENNEIRAGQLDAPEGFEHWLLKFDGMGEDKELGDSTDNGRVEYAYYLMAKKAGIDINPCRLLHENGRSHFMTKRFDRDAGNVRHHMQTLCAMDHLDYKKKGAHNYEQLFMAMNKLNLPYEQKEEAFRRMAFNVLARNCDDHTKNTSFRLRQGQNWELAPAYDLAFAYNPNGRWTDQHFMAVQGKHIGIAKADLLNVADRFAIGSGTQVFDQVAGAVAQWKEFADKAEVSPKATKIIQDQLPKL